METTENGLGRLAAAAIRQAYNEGRRSAAIDAATFIGTAAVTVSADALRTHLTGYGLQTAGTQRLKPGVDMHTINYSGLQPKTPDGDDPYDFYWWGVKATEDEAREVSIAVREALDTPLSEPSA